MTGRSSASQRAQSIAMPGVWPALANSSGLSPRRSQPVRYNSQPPSGSGPCSASQVVTSSMDSRKSGSSAARSAKSSTTAGATSRAGGTWDTSSLSWPVTQWTGASRWVPVCSPVRMLFQYHAGPRASYRLISTSSNGQVLPNGSGSARIGVFACSGAVRSTISTEPLAMAPARSDSSDMPRSYARHGVPSTMPIDGRERRWTSGRY